MNPDVSPTFRRIRSPPVVPIQRQAMADSAISASNARTRPASTATTIREGPSPNSVRPARVVPARLAEIGYRFRRPDLDDALRAATGRS